MFPALAVAVTPQQPDSPRRDAQTTEQRSTACQEHRHTVLTAPTPSLDGPLVREIITRGVTTAAGATLAWGTGHLTPGTRRRSATMGLTALVATQLAQTLLTRHRSPLVLATSIGSAAVLVGIVQTPGVSHFFGCTPLGPFAWTTVLATTATAAAASIIAPAQFARPEGTPATRSNGRPDSANTE
jgi:cation-transporting ATPase I